MNQKVQRLSVKGIVYHDGKIFMLKDSKDMWEFPGGRIDFGECPKESLKREFMEELGVKKIAVGDIINIWDFVVDAEDDSYHFVLVVFECKADLSNINLSDEHLEYKWIELDKIQDYPMRNGYIESIEKFKQLKKI